MRLFWCARTLPYRVLFIYCITCTSRKSLDNVPSRVYPVQVDHEWNQFWLEADTNKHANKLKYVQEFKRRIYSRIRFWFHGDSQKSRKYLGSNHTSEPVISQLKLIRKYFTFESVVQNVTFPPSKKKKIWPKISVQFYYLNKYLYRQ